MVSMKAIKPQVEFVGKLILNPGLVLDESGLCDIQQMDKTIGTIINRQLALLNKTQTWLAEEVQVSNNAVTKWIRSGKISRVNAKKTAAALKISVDELLGSTSAEKDDDYSSLVQIYESLSDQGKKALLAHAEFLQSQNQKTNPIDAQGVDRESLQDTGPAATSRAAHKNKFTVSAEEINNGETTGSTAIKK
ncbi:MAG TPA: helix-turn-helix transcriptional regulator [Methylophilaceae bacterium]|nr:helix-turn-helix transcriptional regulator [Methylophilaceae bacterium]